MRKVLYLPLKMCHNVKLKLIRTKILETIPTHLKNLLIYLSERRVEGEEGRTEERKEGEGRKRKREVGRGERKTLTYCST